MEAEARLTKIKQTLGIPPTCPDTDIDEQLATYVKANKKKKQDFEKLKSDLNKARADLQQATSESDLIKTKMSSLQFEIRQNENTIKRISRAKRSNALIPPENRGEAVTITTTSIDVSNLDCPERGPEQEVKFCIVCKNEYLPTRSTTCKTHTKPCRRGQWTCCRNPSYKGVAGCRMVPHLYIDRTPDRGVRVTDGVRQMEICD